MSWNKIACGGGGGSGGEIFLHSSEKSRVVGTEKSEEGAEVWFLKQELQQF